MDLRSLLTMSMGRTSTPALGLLTPATTITITLHTISVTSAVPGMSMSTTSTTLITSTVRTTLTPTVALRPTLTTTESTTTLVEEPVPSPADIPFNQCNHGMRQAGPYMHQLAGLCKVTLAVFVFLAVAAAGLGLFAVLVVIVNRVWRRCGRRYECVLLGCFRGLQRSQSAN